MNKKKMKQKATNDDTNSPNTIVSRIYCCECEQEVEARLTNGKEIYPHRNDLYGLPFWKCDDCGNYVGCHHKTKNRTRPLGVIPSEEIKKARRHIHEILDWLWNDGGLKRKKVYKEISDGLGYEYHTAEIRSIDVARDVYRILLDMQNELIKERL